MYWIVCKLFIIVGKVVLIIVLFKFVIVFDNNSVSVIIKVFFLFIFKKIFFN